MKQLTAPDKQGELLKAGYVLSVTGSALVEWFASGGIKQGPVAVNASNSFGPFDNDVSIVISALAGTISYDFLLDSDDLSPLQINSYNSELELLTASKLMNFKAGTYYVAGKPYSYNGEKFIANDSNNLLRNIGSRCIRNDKWQTGSNVGMSMCEIPLKDNASFLLLVFDGPSAAVGGAALGSGTVTMKMALEVPLNSANYIPITWNGGNPTADISLPGGSLITDPIVIPFTKKRTSVGLRVKQSGGAGIIYCGGSIGGGAAQPQFWKDGLNLDGVDLTVTTGAIGQTYPTLAYFPSAVLSFSERPSVILVGTSIEYGQNDIAWPTDGLIGTSKIIGRDFPTLNWGISTASLATFAGNLSNYPYNRIIALSEYFSHVVIGAPTNDIWTNSSTVAQILGFYNTVIAAFTKKKILAMTVLPRPTSSSDGWLTVAGQTIDAAKEAVRNTLNNTIRQLKVPGISAAIDIAALVEALTYGVPNGAWDTKPAIVTGSIAPGTVPNASGGTTNIGILTITGITSGEPKVGMVVTGGTTITTPITVITGVKDNTAGTFYVNQSQTVADGTTLTLSDVNEAVHPTTAMYKRMLPAFNPGAAF